MAESDVQQIIDRLIRIETKQDDHADKIEDIREEFASMKASNGQKEKNSESIYIRMAAYGGLLAGIAAWVAPLFAKGKP